MGVSIPHLADYLYKGVAAQPKLTRARADALTRDLDSIPLQNNGLLSQALVGAKCAQELVTYESAARGIALHHPKPLMPFYGMSAPKAARFGRSAFFLAGNTTQESELSEHA